MVTTRYEETVRSFISGIMEQLPPEPRLLG